MNTLRSTAPPALVHSYSKALKTAWPDTSRRNADKLAADYADIEPYLENALHNYCWAYSDRPTVAVIARALMELAAFDGNGTHRKRAARGLKAALEMLEQ